ncbi:MAG TPA: sulfatase-like hydrolase/transferase [bacterium]|nr:sulfatase-like hydrolase/transferase [bacterium]HQP97270.1 sulfatase-like hydrolase/transferase [bacterium]
MVWKSCCCALALLLISGGCSRSVHCPKANVLLVSIDTCRADHTSPYGYPGTETLTLAALASEGILFEEAFTPVPLTLPAHSSLFTGWYPARHGVRDNANYMLTDDAVTLAEVLQQNGYATAGFVAVMLLSRQRGIAQGFDLFDDNFSASAYGAGKPNVERNAEEIGTAAINWLQTNKRSPFFLFVHFYDPHIPYTPPSPWDGDYAERPYDGEIAYVDYQLGQLIVWMQKNGLLENTLIVVMSDHGESLWEHHEMAHGMFLYNCTLHVPLIMRLPDTARTSQLEGARVKGTVNLIDVMPTILDLVELPCPEMDGVSFLPCLSGEQHEVGPIFAESMYPLFFNWSPLYAIYQPPWKYILAPEQELYNLEEDPKEEKNLYSEEHPKVAELKPILQEEMARLEEQSHVAGLKPEKTEILGTLGYVSGGTIRNTTLSNLPDPKSRTRVYVLIDEGLAQMAKGEMGAAEFSFLQASKQDPENPSPYLNLGEIYARQRQWAKALLYTQRTLDLAPDNLWAQLQMANILIEAERYDEARNRFLAIRQDFPLLSSAQFGLGRIAEAEGNLEEALHWYSEALRITPNLPGLRDCFRRAQGKMKRPADG